MRIILFIILLTIYSCGTTKKYYSTSTNSIPSEQVDSNQPSAPFHTEINYEWAHEAVKVANCLANNKEFIKAVEAIDKFDYSEDNGKDVIKSIKQIKCGVRVYKTTNPWSKAIATTYASDKQFLYLNLRSNPRPMEAMVNTLWHECLHLAGYSHGDNSPIGKENSVNYFVGKVAQEYTHLCK